MFSLSFIHIRFQLAEIFEVEIDPVMQSLGFCCGRKFTYSPQTLCCYGQQLCTIGRDSKYFYYENKYGAHSRYFPNGIKIFSFL